jgi:hypothetical protein
VNRVNPLREPEGANMNPLRPSRRQPLFAPLLTVVLLTSIAFAITASFVSSIAGAAPPTQCPAGTVLNVQTHACAPVKPPTTAAPAAKPAVKSAMPPAAITAPKAVKLNCPAPANQTCPPTAASCQTKTVSESGPNCFTATYTFTTSKPATCVDGYWGANCTACPGGASNPCSGNGSCGQGVSGNGTCTCYSGFTGAACQTSTSH